MGTFERGSSATSDVSATDVYPSIKVEFLFLGLAADTAQLHLMRTQHLLAQNVANKFF